MVLGSPAAAEEARLPRLRGALATRAPCWTLRSARLASGAQGRPAGGRLPRAGPEPRPRPRQEPPEVGLGRGALSCTRGRPGHRGGARSSSPRAGRTPAVPGGLPGREPCLGSVPLGAREASGASAVAPPGRQRPSDATAGRDPWGGTPPHTPRFSSPRTPGLCSPPRRLLPGLPPLPPPQPPASVFTRSSCPFEAPAGFRASSALLPRAELPSGPLVSAPLHPFLFSLIKTSAETDSRGRGHGRGGGAYALVKPRPAPPFPVPVPFVQEGGGEVTAEGAEPTLSAEGKPGPPRPVPGPLDRPAETPPRLFQRGRAWPAVLSPQNDQVCLPGTVWLFLVFVERMRRRRREKSDRFRGQATKAPPQSSWIKGLRGCAGPSWRGWCEGPHRTCPWELELMVGRGWWWSSALGGQLRFPQPPALPTAVRAWPADVGMVV